MRRGGARASATRRMARGDADASDACAMGVWSGRDDV